MLESWRQDGGGGGAREKERKKKKSKAETCQRVRVSLPGRSRTARPAVRSFVRSPERGRARARARRACEERRRGLRSRCGRVRRAPASGCAQWSPSAAPLFVAANMFSVRVVTADYYMSSPLPGLDPCQSSFREAPVKKVPVVRVFGATPSGKDGRPLARSLRPRPGRRRLCWPWDPACLLALLFGDGWTGLPRPPLSLFASRLATLARCSRSLPYLLPPPPPLRLSKLGDSRGKEWQPICTSEHCAGGGLRAAQGAFPSLGTAPCGTLSCAAGRWVEDLGAFLCKEHTIRLYAFLEASARSLLPPSCIMTIMKSSCINTAFV